MSKYILEFELLGLPKMTNPSGSKSTHWRGIKKERDHWIAMVAAIAKPKRPPAPLEKAKLTLTRYSSVCPDPDGLTSGFKAVVDSLVKSGILQNDKMKNIGFPDYRWEKAPPGAGRVKIRVEEI